jgi:peptidyl-prolyl isomerase E (cyclophilin E)
MTQNFVIVLSDTTRGFGFVEYENEEDCADAIENMEGAELFGRVLRCNIAKPMTKAPSGKAVWSADDWIQNSLKDGDNLDTYDEGEGAYGSAMKPTISGVSE